MIPGLPMKALVEILERNALMPRADIARMLDMSVEDVEKEITRLEQEGIILGYQAVVSREKWDADKVTALIEVKIMPERDGGFDRVAERVSKFEEVQTCYLMSGGYDLLITVEARDLRAVAAFVAEKLSTIGSVQSTATHFRLKTYKENGMFHHYEQTPERLAVTP
jgi:DNA-binding Lrp family transcriptional regulator